MTLVNPHSMEMEDQNPRSTYWTRRTYREALCAIRLAGFPGEHRHRRAQMVSLYLGWDWSYQQLLRWLVSEVSDLSDAQRPYSPPSIVYQRPEYRWPI